MAKDTLYASDDIEAVPFEFNDEVAEVFPDMLRRSIPGYGASIQAIGTLASRYVQPQSRCYDLGCSLGAASIAMYRNITAEGCRIVAADNSPAMVERCRKSLKAEENRMATELSVLEADIRDIEITRASMVVMNYTLQFLPLEARLPLIRKIAGGMLPGGVFVLSEKVTDPDPGVEQVLVDLHHEFKRRNAYSELEISRKRTALENVLLPETVAEHEQRLRESGFSHVGVWLRYFNFVSLIAIR